MENHQEEQDREAYTLQQAADLLQVTTRTVRNWIRDKKIHAFKLGVAWRIRREEVARLLKRPAADERKDFPDIPYGEYGD